MLVVAMAVAVCVGAAADEKASLPLVFWDVGDIVDPFGRIQFGAEPLENEGIATGYPDMQYGCEAPAADTEMSEDGVPPKGGETWIYGWRVRDWGEADKRVLQIVRCKTGDGRTFRDEAVVFEYVRAQWQGFVNIVRRPTDGALFVFSWAEWPGKLHVFRSDNGTDWTLLTDNAYEGHDAMCVMWHAESGQFVNYQTVVQPYPKRYPDNIGERRRVLSFMGSTDGVAWEPFAPGFLEGRELWEPDGEDPIDLEFYRVVAFPLQGRYAMILNGYVPPPSEANSRRAITKHGPPYMSEWAISRDGVNWARPFRDTNVYEHQFWLALQGPLVREGRLRFYHPDGRMARLPEGRVFYATCRANGEFSTRAFVMPEGGRLALNADVRYREAEGDRGQAYVMVEVLDADGAVIEGYERTGCLFEDVDGEALPLTWGDKTGSELAGKEVRLRILLRDAKVYGVDEESH